MKFSKLLTTSVALGALLLSSVSSAAYITGDIAFTGLVEAGQGGIGHADNSFNGEVDFLTDTGLVAFVSSPSDLNLFVSVGDVVTLSDFDVDTLPTANIWTVGGFSFDLTTMAVSHIKYSLDSGVIDDVIELTLNGRGVLSGNGYDNTIYAWSLSLDRSLPIFFSATSAPIPEPSIIALLGLGLVGMGVANRRKQKLVA